MAQERDQFIDFIKGIGIFLVAWGHAMVPRSEFLYSFHMPLFFAISGYLFTSRNVLTFTISKLRYLLLPFILFFLLSWGFQATVFMILGRGEPTLFDFPHVAWRFLLGDSDVVNNSPLWFLTCLFCLTILFYAMEKLKYPILIFAVSLLIGGVGVYFSKEHIELPLKFQIACTALPFFALGWLLKQPKASFIVKNKVLFSLLIPVYLVGHYFLVDLNIASSGIKKVNMYANTIGDPLFFYLSGLLGTLWFVFTSMWIYKVWKPNFIHYLGRNSLLILVLHYPMINICRVLVDKYVNIESWVYGLTVGILVTIGCVAIIKVWDLVKIKLLTFPK